MEEPETRGRRIQQPLRIAALPCLGLLLQTQQCKRLQCQPEMTSHLTESPGPGVNMGLLDRLCQRLTQTIGRTPFRRDRTNPDSIQPGPTDSSVSDTEEQKEAQKQDPGPQTLAAGVGSHCSTFCAEPPDPGTKRKASGSPRGQLAPISEDEEKPRKSRVREALASFIRTMGAHGLLEKSASRPLIDFLVRQCTLILDSTEEADRRRTMELEVRQLCSSTLQCLGDSPRMANVLWPGLLLQLSPAAHGPALPLLLQMLVRVVKRMQEEGRLPLARRCGKENRGCRSSHRATTPGATGSAAGARCIFVYDGAGRKGSHVPPLPADQQVPGWVGPMLG
ncbi:uncharacterized protein LOC120396362 isoform X5 [Mauremys reevesii]|uniref:uncharacterized protein LOC120396362 isoform X5 n=1 Tax=Mauremys reevesii TaxID=260615 RepID=UPI00193F87E1|nr:uncharacterized protein LOC120396362 isoform X5 [Mauremys reevesii]XP_039377082.1 uncharacterized protein LOC120396362 isoform X5 [Mauremys reevesii]